MEKIPTVIWYVIISIAAIIVVWHIGKSSGKNSIRNEFEQRRAEPKKASVNDPNSDLKTDQTAKKRDISDTDILKSESKETKETQN